MRPLLTTTRQHATSGQEPVCVQAWLRTPQMHLKHQRKHARRSWLFRRQRSLPIRKATSRADYIYVTCCLLGSTAGSTCIAVCVWLGWARKTADPISRANKALRKILYEIQTSVNGKERQTALHEEKFTSIRRIKFRSTRVHQVCHSRFDTCLDYLDPLKVVMFHSVMHQ
jgi:hypothetical protein